MRLKNINLRNALKKCEAKLRAKEQLAEGLHLIDFEQLKIENQALAEKIEDRKDEIEKLRKKHAANVRVATHARETLAFEEKLCEKRRGELKALDAKLAVERDRVAKLKKRREKKRMREASRSESKGFAANDMLVLDYEKRKVEITQTEARIQEQGALRAARGGCREEQRARCCAHGGGARSVLSPCCESRYRQRPHRCLNSRLSRKNVKQGVPLNDWCMSSYIARGLSL